LHSLFNLHSLLELLLGISLSAAAGFRVFVPLLVLSVGAVVGHLDLPTNLDWAETPQALAVFACASALEIGGYYIPWFDHLLDLVATPAAVIAGTAITAAVAPDLNPIMQWTLALVAGGGTAGLTKGLTNILRLTSTAISGGLSNPVLATIELAIAILISILAITIPLAAIALAAGILGFAVIKIGKFLTQLFAKRQASTTL
jgi:Domain of unknown function (DUF4126)